MTPFCLQQAKTVYKIDHVFKGKSTQRLFLQLECLSKGHITSSDNAYYIYSGQLKYLLQLYPFKDQTQLRFHTESE